MPLAFKLLYSPILFLFYILAVALKGLPIKWRSQSLKAIVAFVSGGETFFSGLEKQLSGNRKKTVHIHCASVGEFKQTEGIAERLLEAGYAVVLTYSSLSLHDWLKHGQEKRFLYYHFMPVGFRKNMDMLYDRLNPVCLIIAKDLWVNMLCSAKARHIPLFLVSANISKSRANGGCLGWYFRFCYAQFTVIFAVSELYKQRFNKLCPQANCRVTGDPRFDTTHSHRLETPPKILNNEKDTFVFIVGSSHREDHAVILPVLNKFLAEYPKLKVIIAPHHPVKEEFNDIQSYLNAVPPVYYNKDWQENTSFRVLIIDGIGILSKLYQYADAAYIGGGFSTGIHNTMEPSVQLVPCIFGPRYEKFPEAVDLIETGLANVVNDSKNFETVLAGYLSDNTLSKKQEKLNRYVQSQLGAAEKNFQTILSIIEQP